MVAPGPEELIDIPCHVMPYSGWASPWASSSSATIAYDVGQPEVYDGGECGSNRVPRDPSSYAGTLPVNVRSTVRPGMDT